ncbi:hypothetical protein U1Q18_027863 [Sarracenia purpurea var. burkii]
MVDSTVQSVRGTSSTGVSTLCVPPLTVSVEDPSPPFSSFALDPPGSFSLSLPSAHTHVSSTTSSSAPYSGDLSQIISLPYSMQASQQAFQSEMSVLTKEEFVHLLGPKITFFFCLSVFNCEAHFLKAFNSYFYSIKFVALECWDLLLSAMNFEFLSNIPWFGTNANKDTGTTFMSTTALLETPKQRVAHFDIRLWGWSLLSIFPWVINARDKIQVPSVVSKELKRHGRPSDVVDYSIRNSYLQFRPYVSKVPWHTGARAFLSQLFPRYGHYCGPNWSSGKDGGSLIWDKRPIDWLDFCCYCHDIGYDTHNQSELLTADVAFLECLERPHMSTKGDAHVAHLYKTMCISGTHSALVLFFKTLTVSALWEN